MNFKTTVILLFLIASNNILLYGQELNWVRHFREMPASSGGTYHEQYVNGFEYTNDGGMISYGFFEDDVDFDPGPGQNVSSVGPIGQGFVVKLDSLGNFVWKRIVFGGYGCEIKDVDVDEDGFVYCTGSTRGGSDWDAFVVKLDSLGTLIWKQDYGDNSNHDYGHKISVYQGKIYLAGMINGTVNVDPIFSGTAITTTYENNFVLCTDTNRMFNWINNAPSNGYQGIVLDHNSQGELFYGYNTGANFHFKKYDVSGNLLFHKDWGPGSDLYIEGIAFDQDGGIYLAGRGFNEVYSNPIYDMDPGVNEHLFNGGIFYMRLDANGEFYMGNAMGGSMWNQYVISSANGIDVDYRKNVYISGSFKSTVDFDPDPLSVASMSASSFAMDGFVARYDSLGNYIWAYEIGSAESDYSKYIHVDADMTVTNAGAFNCSIDFDPSVGITNVVALGCNDWFEDGYIQQVKQDSCDHLGIIIDSIAGMDCMTNGYVTCHGINSIPPYSYSWDGGSFNANPEFYPNTPGSHTVIVMAANGCIDNRTVQVGGPITAQIDAQVNCVPGVVIPGVNGSLIIDGYNGGCTATSGQITFIVPDLMNFDSSSVIPDYVNGDTLVWFYSNFNYQSPHFVTEIFYSTDTLATIGDSLCFPLTITPLVDDYSPNNTRSYCLPVVTSYDPNNKFVYPSGVCIPNFIDTSDRLTYSVNFQNTGTSEAINIYLLDEIDSDLDVSTLRIVGSSFPVQTEILTNNLVKFRLDDIYLPDSSSNIEESNGYIIFELEQIEALPNYTEIINSIDIFFDYNAPVHTNSVFNTVVDVIPGSDYINVQMTVCDSAIINSQTYIASGNYLLDLSNQYGCDSLVNIDLTVRSSTLSTLNLSVCDSIVIAGQEFDSTGYYEIHINNSVGCDSLIQLDLILLNTMNSITIDTCTSILINGVQYENSGVYSQILVNQNGCDSLLLIDYTRYDNFFNTLTVTECDSFVMNGVTYLNDGTYFQTLSSTYGCDSIIQLQLTILDQTESELFIDGLDSVLINGTMYYYSGIYEQTLSNSIGCDSVITIHLTMEYNGFNMLAIEDIEIFPNPTFSIVHVKSPIIDDSKVTILDSQGRIQKVNVIYLSGELIIDLLDLVPGLYFIDFDSGLIPTISIIKE